MKKKKYTATARLEKEALSFVKKVRKNIATAILAAFAFVIALIWRDAIQEGVNSFVVKFNLPQEGYLFKITAAVIVTLICIIGIIVFSRWAEKKQ